MSLDFSQLIVRWTIGDVSKYGFETLYYSIWGAYRLFGPRARYIVCVNSVSLREAREKIGPVPDEIEWHDATGTLPKFLLPYLAPGMTEGTAWKFANLRLDATCYELALDNDCILWRISPAITAWFAAANR